MAFTEVSLPPRDTTNAPAPNVMWCRGEHDMATVPALAEMMVGVISRDASDVVLDMSAVEFMDASTVGFVVRADIVLQGSARTLTVRSPSVPARRVLDVCGVAYGPLSVPTARQ